MVCDAGGERCIVGDKVGSVHVWRLMDDEPKLIMVKESILEVGRIVVVPRWRCTRVCLVRMTCSSSFRSVEIVS